MRETLFLTGPLPKHGSVSAKPVCLEGDQLRFVGAIEIALYRSDELVETHKEDYLGAVVVRPTPAIVAPTRSGPTGDRTRLMRPRIGNPTVRTSVSPPYP